MSARISASNVPDAGVFAPASPSSVLWPCGIPHALHAVAGNVAGFGILDPQVERHAVLGPLFLPVLAGHERICTVGLGVVTRHEGRPVLGAIVVAIGHVL